MLKIEIKPGEEPGTKEACLEVTGSLQDTLEDLADAIRQIHTSLLEHDPEAAQGFRYLLLARMLDPEGDIWRPDEELEGTCASILLPKTEKED